MKAHRSRMKFGRSTGDNAGLRKRVGDNPFANAAVFILGEVEGLPAILSGIGLKYRHLQRAFFPIRLARVVAPFYSVVHRIRRRLSSVSRGPSSSRFAGRSWLCPRGRRSQSGRCDARDRQRLDLDAHPGGVAQTREWRESVDHPPSAIPRGVGTRPAAAAGDRPVPQDQRASETGAG